MNRATQFSLFLSALCIFAAGLVAAEPRPNVIVIMVDDLGYGDLSCYGAKDLRTPAIDSLAERGMRFDTFYANSCVCSPSRASLLSGRYPELAGVPGVIRTHSENSFGYLAASATLLPASLKKSGYHSVIVGKWHLGLEPENSPIRRGFDHFHGWLADMMDSYTAKRRHSINYMRKGETEIDPPGHATDLFTQWAIDYVKERAPLSKEGKPFFLYLAYNAPHNPVEPPADWLAKVKQRESNLTPKRAALVALIEHMDDGVGKVLAAIKESGIEDKTLVIFVSDNGGDLPQGATNGPLRNGKGSMYEGGLRVPMIVAWPGKIAPQSTSSVAAAHMDLMPTVCEAAGAPAPAEIDGLSILPVLTGRDSNPKALAERPLFFVRREGGPYWGMTIHSVRKGDLKLIYNTPFSPFELYNLKNDPKEETDIAAKAPKLRNELAKALQLQLIRAGSAPWRKPAERE